MITDLIVHLKITDDYQKYIYQIKKSIKYFVQIYSFQKEFLPKKFKNIIQVADKLKKKFLISILELMLECIFTNRNKRQMNDQLKFKIKYKSILMQHLDDIQDYYYIIYDIFLP